MFFVSVLKKRKIFKFDFFFYVFFLGVRIVFFFKLSIEMGFFGLVFGFFVIEWYVFIGYFK